jgi:hypothetical protein
MDVVVGIKCNEGSGQSLCVRVHMHPTLSTLQSMPFHKLVLRQISQGADKMKSRIELSEAHNQE